MIGHSRSELCLYHLKNGDTLVLKDDVQITLDYSANAIETQSTQWSERPLCLEYVEPYSIALLPR